MFSRVESSAMLAQYNRIWMEVWEEKGYELEVSESVFGQYLIYDRDKPVGCTEFKAYHETSAINEVFPFNEMLEIQHNIDRVMEVDKVAILKPYRGKNIEKALYLMTWYAERHHVKYYVTLMEPVFARSLKIAYRVPFIQADSKIFYKGDYVIPIIIQAEYVYQHKEEFSFIPYLPSTGTGS